MDQPLTDRRQETRFLAPLLRLTHATLRPGHAVTLVDLCASGALLETQRPLRPGSRVHLQVATDARTVALIGRVLRCAVFRINPHEGITYRGAVKFDDRCDLFWERGTLAGSSVPGVTKLGTGGFGKPIPGEADRTAGQPRSHTK